MSVLSQSRSQATVAKPSAVDVRRLRLPYNAPFLPEYLSTVILSLLISSFFLSNLNGRGWVGLDNDMGSIRQA